MAPVTSQLSRFLKHCKAARRSQPLSRFHANPPQASCRRNQPTSTSALSDFLPSSSSSSDSSLINTWHNYPLSLWQRSIQTFAESSGEKKEDSRGPNTAALQNTWVNRYLPARIQPFALLARLDKPIGTWLLAWPCAWSITIAAPTGNFPDFQLLAIFGIGAILLRGAGCTFNDLLDQDIDKKVERTRLRPIASGAVSPFQGLAFLGCQLLLGLGILLQLNTFSQILGACSLFFVGTYPLFKRWTYWPQAFLGLTINWGALLGWAAVKGSVDISVVAPLYFAGICWTLIYDTIYAHQDKHDDVKVGVKSTALYFGNQTKLWLKGFAAATIGSLLLAGHAEGLGWTFYSGMLGAATHLYWQISTVDLHDPADCNAKFVSNKWFGAIIFAGIIGGKFS